MWTLARPTAVRAQAHRDAQRSLAYSYPGVGITRDDGDAPFGYDHDRNREELGRGEPVFERAREAIRTWEMFPAPLATIEPKGIPIEEGEVAGVVMRVFGLWFLNAARIVYVIDEPRRFGFAYGTLPGHVEAGEERFLVEWLLDDTVVYSIVAFSQPRYWLARLGKPMARRLQRTFVRLSKLRMRELCSDGHAAAS